MQLLTGNNKSINILTYDFPVKGEASWFCQILPIVKERE